MTIEPNLSMEPNLPDGWSEDAYWLAARHLLKGFGARVWQHAGPLGIDFDAILDEPWSGGERRILLAAASLWNGSQRVDLCDLVGHLDRRHLQRLLEAIAIQHGGRR